MCGYSGGAGGDAGPRPTKEFTIILPSEQQKLLSSYRSGKVVMMAFVFTTYPHCQAFSQVVTQLNTECGPRGFQALGVAVDDETERCR